MAEDTVGALAENLTAEELAALMAEVEWAARQVELDPARYRSYLPLQESFRKDPSHVKLIRAGNQTIGKTTAMLDDIHERCIGDHRYLEVRPPPVEWWVVCAETAQSVAIQKKFYDVSKAYLADDCEFDDATGFRGRNPIARYRNGSIVRFKTTNQSSISFAGATLTGGVGFDEPPKSSRLYSEARKRVLRHGGHVLLALTPVNAPTEWLQEEVEAGRVSDHHTRLTPEQFIPVGETEPLWSKHPITAEPVPMDQAYIDALEETTIAYEVPVVVHGEWQFRVQGRYFKAWDGGAMITSVVPRTSLKLLFGVDHGTRKGKEMALLVLVDEDDNGLAKRVWVWDEYVGTEMTTMTDDAQGIIEMLGRSGWTWVDIDEAHGDRTYMRGAESKSNADLMVELAKFLGYGPRISPSIRTVKRGKGAGRGSVDIGGRFLHDLMLRKGFKVHPRCTRLIEALDRWDFTDSDYKDPIDALRYALNTYIFRSRFRGSGGPTPVYMYGTVT